MTIIYSPTGWHAHFTAKDGGPGTILDVVSWHPENGDAMVVDSKGGCLREARSYQNFSHLEEVSRIAAVLPGGGWYWASRDEATGEIHRMQVVGWIVDGDGTANPLCADSREYWADTVTPETMPDAVLTCDPSPDALLRIHDL